ncbi:hypothetical protein CTP10_R65470 (plasmid) [Cupriavidus sp. P-10]|uniref:hypothetical protein n=1 Tax=Cupriavidus sp. P-10 TaxID=2027911 RepID=UPI0011C1833F|nr:hypothetical protein [Cupriavidus sp. P-10]BDB29134.1 hypothetical protein CTP10_R65470 [Cupriavidus sp. P-10]
MLTLKEILENRNRRWTLDDMSPLRPGIHVWGMYAKPPMPGMTRLVEELSPVMLLDEQADAFLRLASKSGVRIAIDSDLHPSTHDGEAGVSFSAVISFAAFREFFCGDDEADLDPGVSALRSLLRWQTIGWGSAGADNVDIRFNCNLSAAPRVGRKST